MTVTGALVVVQFDDRLVAAYGHPRSISWNREVMGFGPSYMYASPYTDITVEMLAQQVITTVGDFADFWDRFRQQDGWQEQTPQAQLPDVRRALGS